MSAQECRPINKTEITHLDLSLNEPELYEIPEWVKDCVNLQSLNLKHNSIKNIKASDFPPRIESLNLEDNLIENIDDLPDGIIDLNVVYNKINRIGKLPKGIKKFNCMGNQINNIDNISADTLEILICADNCIKDLPNLPPNLKVLNCSNNFIKFMHYFPVGLEILICCKNGITELFNLPPQLKLLKCTGNYDLRIIECFPKSIKVLICDKYAISNINELESSIEKVYDPDEYRYRNMPNLINLSVSVSEMNNLPQTLKILYCTHNTITELNNRFPRNIAFYQEEDYYPENLN